MKKNINFDYAAAQRDTLYHMNHTSPANIEDEEDIIVYETYERVVERLLKSVKVKRF